MCTSASRAKPTRWSAIGLISFAAVAQFAPAIFGGIYWKGGTAPGAIAGLAPVLPCGPTRCCCRRSPNRGGCPSRFIEGRPVRRRAAQAAAAVRSDRPGRDYPQPVLEHAGQYRRLRRRVAGRRRPGVVETSQATLFVDVFRRTAGGEGSRVWRGSAQVGDLLPLIGRFLGPERAQRGLPRLRPAPRADVVDELQADAELVHYAETLLAGAIGSASARVMVASVVEGGAARARRGDEHSGRGFAGRAYCRQLEQKSRELEEATAELRAANARLQELDRMKDDFISTVSHELRTPLTSIRAFSEILRDDPAIEFAERERFLGIIIKETERLTRLINQVLDLAKLESGNAEWHAERNWTCAR